jgi:hypothetical protein
MEKECLKRRALFAAIENGSLHLPPPFDSQRKKSSPINQKFLPHHDYGKWSRKSFHVDFFRATVTDIQYWEFLANWEPISTTEKSVVLLFLSNAPNSPYPHGLNMELDLQKFIWAPCHVMCTAVLIG